MVLLDWTRLVIIRIIRVGCDCLIESRFFSAEIGLLARLAVYRSWRRAIAVASLSRDAADGVVLDGDLLLAVLLGAEEKEEADTTGKDNQETATAAMIPHFR